MYEQIESQVRDTHNVVKNFVTRSDEKFSDLSDRLAGLEQKNTSFIDFHGAPERPSLMKIIRHLSNPRDNPLEGREQEWHSELQRKNKGANVPAGSVWIPLQTKTVDYNTPNFNSPLTSAGGSNLVQQELYPELIDLLRQESVVMSQGIRIIPAMGDLDIPKKTSGATAYWLDMDGSDSITPSTPVFGSVPLRPKFVTALTKVSYRMMLQTGNEAGRIVEQDLAATLAEAVDLAALQGTGANSQPTGVLGAGISSLTWGGSSSPVGDTSRFWFEDALLSEKTLIDSKSYKGNLSWLCDSASWRIIQHQVSSQDEHMSLVSDGRVLNRTISPTSHMPSNTVLFGNWADFVMATWGGIAIAIDQGGDNFAKGDSVLRAVLPVDFAVRHAASFVKNVRP